jgi:hypothetical protein
MKIVYEKDKTTVFRYGIHHANSHEKDQSKYLNPAQKKAIKDAVRLSPMTPGKQVRRQLKNLEDKKTHVPPKLADSVTRLVRKNLI